MSDLHPLVIRVGAFRSTCLMSSLVIQRATFSGYGAVNHRMMCWKPASMACAIESRIVTAWSYETGMLIERVSTASCASTVATSRLIPELCRSLRDRESTRPARRR